MKVLFYLFLGALISSTSFINVNGQVEPIRIQDTDINQVTGCRLQVAGTNQTTNYELRTTNCNNRVLSKLAYADAVQGVDGASGSLWQELLDASSTGATKQFAAEVEFRKDSNQDDDIDCYLMMEPAAIEEAEQALKKGLRISGENASPSQTTSVSSRVQVEESTLNAVDPHPNVFTIVKNQTTTSATASTSEQQMDPVLGKKVQGAINKVISHSSAQLQDHYKKADEAWGACDHGWKEQSRIYHELQESRKQLTLSEQKLEQANKATTDEELEKTRLAKISKYALMAGSMIGNTPDPHIQAVRVGVSGLGVFAGAINMAWAHGNLMLAKREHQQISEQHEQIQGQKDHSHQQLLLLKQHAEEVETLSSSQAEQSARKCAEQLHPQTDWKETQWQAWGSFVSPTWSEKESFHLIDLVRLNPNWVESVTKKSWEQKVETGKEQYIALQKKANLASLKRSYESALQQYQRAQTQEEQQRNFLNQGQNSIEDLKLEIEKRVDEMERLETRDKVQFEQKKKEFIEKLKELEKTQLRNQELQKKWEAAVQRTTTQEEQRWTASETYQNAKEEAERTLIRGKKAYQTDRELLQRIWLKSATSNYKDWSVPEISTSHVVENTLNSSEERGTHEMCEPPLQRLEELERQGRNLRIRGAMMSITTTKKPTVLTAILHPFSKQPSFYYSAPSNLDQVKEWVQQRQEQPSSQDRERWETREKLDQLQKEISSIRKELQKENEGKKCRDSDALAEDDDDVDSNASNATKQTGAATTLSISKSSAFSIGGKTLFGNKKQPLSLLPSINEGSQDFEEILKQLQEQARELKKEYFDLLDHAENERLSPLKGQKEAIPFSEETDRNGAWEEADRKSVTLIQEKRREQEREKIAQEQQESWQTNTERWRLCVQADQALKVFRRAQQRTLKLGDEADKAKTKAQLTAANKKRDEALAEEKRLQEAYFEAEEAWEKMAQEYRDERSEQNMLPEQANEEIKEKANERLKERDRAVNKRWEKLLKSYQNSELEKSAVDQEEISEAIINLENQLEQAYQDSRIAYSGQKALDHYQEVAFQRALDNARNHPEEMAEIWEKIAAEKKNVTAAQLEKLEINKQAAKVFKEEARRLEKIEKIWKGILQEEQEEKKQAREQASQEYHRGYYSDWNALSEQERTYYNNEVRKSNEEYDQKRDEIKKQVGEAHAEELRVKAEIEAETKKIEGSLWYSMTSTKRKEKLKQLQQQLAELENSIKKNSDELKEQEDSLKIGYKARQTENYYQSLTQAQQCEEKVKEQKNNIYWQQAAQCYRKASTHWQEAADDKTLETQRKQNEQVAVSYDRSAEAYEKAAQEHTVLLTAQGAQETLVTLSSNKAKLYEQLAEQQTHFVNLCNQAAKASATGKTEESDRWNDASDACYWAAEKLMKAIEAENAGKLAIVQKYREAAEQQMRCIELYTESVRAFTEGKTDESALWREAGNGFYDTVEKLEEAIVAEENGMIPQAQELREKAIKYQQKAEQQKQAAEKLQIQRVTIEADRKLIETWNVRKEEMKEKKAKAHTAGKTTEWTSWHNAGAGYCGAAEKQEKATAAEIEDKPEIAKKWREAANQQVDSVEHFIQAAKAYVAKRTDEGDAWNNAGNSCYDAAVKLGKAIEVELEGKLEVAKKWKEVVEQQMRSFELYTKAAKAYIAGKTEAGNSWHNAGGAFYDAAVKLGKAIEAEIEGKPEIAKKWREAAEQQVRSVEPCTQAAKAHMEGKKSEAKSWNGIGGGFYNAAEKLEKAIEAESAGKPEIAQQWRKVVEQQVRSLECYTKEATAFEQGKTSEAKGWNSIGGGFYNAAEKLEKAIEAESAGKPEIAQQWRKVVEQQVRSLECYTKEATVFEQGKTSEAKSWNRVGSGFYNAAEKLEKAIEVESAGKPEVAQKWREVAEQQVRSFESYTKALTAFGQGKTDEGNSWRDAGDQLGVTAEQLEKAMKAESEGKAEEAQRYREAADRGKKMADA